MFACAVVCLAGAIGTATAVFAIVNAVVLRPLPFQHASRLVAVWGVNPARDTVKRGFSWPDTIDLSRSIDDVVVLRDAVESQIANPRLVAFTFNGFAVTASLLAALGLGTLIGWQIRLRTREIGVRLALGATPSQVIRNVMSENVPVVAAGVVVGLGGALLLGRYLETLLFEVAPTDPMSAALAGGAAAALALLTSYVTARTAARIDPLTALRSE